VGILQVGNFAGCNFAGWEFRRLGISQVGNFASWEFCKLGILQSRSQSMPVRGLGSGTT
jgi:hypothetical protein